MNRTEQYFKFQRLLSLARGLNHGSNITGKIIELEGLASDLSRHDLTSPVVPSFSSWVGSQVEKENTESLQP